MDTINSKRMAKDGAYVDKISNFRKEILILRTKKTKNIMSFTSNLNAKISMIL